jgi:hypothetical protein
MTSVKHLLLQLRNARTERDRDYYETELRRSVFANATLAASDVMIRDMREAMDYLDRLRRMRTAQQAAS